MELTQKCRICLTETEFNVSLYGKHCRRTNMIDKILVCLKIVIEENESLDTICYKCAENIESYYNFVMRVKKCQTKLPESRPAVEASVKRHVTSYVREQVFDSDYTFSFLEAPEDKKEVKASSPFFSYFSLPVPKTADYNNIWKTPKTLERRDNKVKKQRQKHLSRDVFESQSQNVDDLEPRSVDWQLTPDDNILKRVREKCFGRSNF